MLQGIRVLDLTDERGNLAAQILATLGADVIAVANVTATAGITASGACQITLSNVNITAPVGITASGSAKVTMTGGSITSSSNAIIASASANVNLAGTKVSGKVTKTGAAKIVGAP